MVVVLRESGWCVIGGQGSLAIAIYPGKRGARAQACHSPSRWPSKPHRPNKGRKTPTKVRKSMLFEKLFIRFFSFLLPRKNHLYRLRCAS